MIHLPERHRILQGLKAEPRLIFTRERIAHAARQIENDPVAAELAMLLQAKGRSVLSTPPHPVHELGQARAFLDEIYSLLMLDGLEPTGGWTQPILERLRVVSAQENWPTEEGLAFAELLHGFSVAVDAVPAASEFRDDLMVKGVEPAAALLATLPWWHHDECNWNVVCHSAFVLAAIVCAEIDPDRCAKLTADSLRALPIALHSFAPDGGWAEGPGYWGFSTRYLGILLESLDSALEHSFGLDELPGVRCAPDFRIQVEGSSGLLFGFGDSYLQPPLDSTLLLWSKRFQNPCYASAFHESLERNLEQSFYGTIARALLWYVAPPSPPGRLPLAGVFAGAEVVTFRSSWTHENALYAAMKAGDIQTPHAHADLGTFVIDCGGTRFAEELGADFYDLPGFWNGRPNTDYARWNYPRNGTMGHNAPMIDGTGQDPLGFANLVSAELDQYPQTATIDLAPAYRSRGVRRLHRTLTFDGDAMEIELLDVYESDLPIEYRWQVITKAEVLVADQSAELTIGGDRMRLSANHPFLSEPFILDAPQKPFIGTRLFIQPPPASAGEIRVRWHAH